MACMNNFFTLVIDLVRCSVLKQGPGVCQDWTLHLERCMG